jgi:hypothetical protein
LFLLFPHERLTDGFKPLKLISCLRQTVSQKGILRRKKTLHCGWTSPTISNAETGSADHKPHRRMRREAKEQG